MRISDWSSDVCSSDLMPGWRGGELPPQPEWSLCPRRGLSGVGARRGGAGDRRDGDRHVAAGGGTRRARPRGDRPPSAGREIGRASWRERVGQYVLISVVVGTLKKKNTQELNND